ncbi:MAG: hypothetical protein F6K30_00965 [Cyanothece sp. SIO2G6]|nr:hypothetical protein [Cyanothece sp. SIO2G6]
MIQRLSAWFIVSVLYGLSIFLSPAQRQQTTLQEMVSTGGLAVVQANPDNAAPHRGSGRCENAC